MVESYYSHAYRRSLLHDSQNQIGKTSMPLDEQDPINDRKKLLEESPTEQEQVTSGARSLPNAMQQLNQALQTPGEPSKIDIGTGDYKAQGTKIHKPGNANAGVSNAAGRDASSDPKAQEKADNAPKLAEAQKEQQNGQAEGGKKSAEGKQAEEQQNAEQNGMQGANDKEEPPGQALNREIQETRQSLRDDQQDEPGPVGQSAPKSMMSGDAPSPGNAEGVLMQTSQKAQRADQDHKRGSKLNIMGKMQELKGQMQVKAGDILSKVGIGISAAGTALWAIGQSMLSNPFTAIPGAIMVTVGNVLKAVGLALKASGEAMKESGENTEKAGQKSGKDGNKLTKKATQGAAMGHRQLEELRNKVNDKKSGVKSIFDMQGNGKPKELNGQNQNEKSGGETTTSGSVANARAPSNDAGNPFALAGTF